MKQTFYVERDPSPMKTSAPWRYVCTSGEGPFKPHIKSGFKTKERALEIANKCNEFVEISLNEKKGV